MIVAPRPRVAPLIPSPVITAETAGIGTEASTGAADRPGVGQGAGGAGNGTGAGGDGDGDGDGDDVPPRLRRGRLQFSDLPSGLRDAGEGKSVSTRYTVEVTGKVGDCAVTVSSGSPELDALTCALIQRRFRFDPSRDRSGAPVRSEVEESYRWTFDHDLDPPGQ